MTPNYSNLSDRDKALLNSVVNKVEISDGSGQNINKRDIGPDAEKVLVYRDMNGEIIRELEPEGGTSPVIVGSIEGAATTLDKLEDKDKSIQTKIKQVEGMLVNSSNIEDTAIASKNYSVGDYIIYNNNATNTIPTFARTITGIKNGDQIISQEVSTTNNVEAKPLSDIISGIVSGIPYGECYDTLAVEIKEVEVISGKFELAKGASIFVHFLDGYGEGSSKVSLKIDNNDPIPIIFNNSSRMKPWWQAGDIVEFVYNGTYFVMQPTQGQFASIQNDIEDLYSKIRQWSPIEVAFANWVINSKAIYNSTTNEVKITFQTNNTSSVPAVVNGSAVATVTNYKPNTNLLPYVSVVQGYLLGFFTGSFQSGPQTTTRDYFTGSAIYMPNNNAIRVYFPISQSAYALNCQISYIAQ